MNRMVEKVDLPVYGEMYVACAEDVSMEAMQALQEPLKKLYEYEQEEENGRLAHLPCRLGDDFYWITDEDPDTGTKREVMIGGKIKGITVTEDGFYIANEDGFMDKIGSRYFLLTREDAERKMKDMEEADLVEKYFDKICKTAGSCANCPLNNNKKCMKYDPDKLLWLKENTEYKPGTPVYKIEDNCGHPADCGHDCRYCPDNEVSINTVSFTLDMLSEIGETVFLSKEAADNKLKDRQEKA